MFLFCLKSGLFSSFTLNRVSNSRPAGQISPTKSFYVARKSVEGAFLNSTQLFGFTLVASALRWQRRVKTAQRPATINMFLVAAVQIETSAIALIETWEAILAASARSFHARINNTLYMLL